MDPRARFPWAGRALVAALFLALLTAPRALARGRSPAGATAVAAVPGAIFHGAGHWYAGDKKTGRILLLSELFGLALMSFDRTSGSVTQRIGNREEERGGGGVSAIGRVLFFGSWLYDLGAAGDAARKTNRKRLRQGLEVQLVPEPEGRRVSFNPRARYTVRF